MCGRDFSDNSFDVVIHAAGITSKNFVNKNMQNPLNQILLDSPLALIPKARNPGMAGMAQKFVTDAASGALLGE